MSKTSKILIAVMVLAVILLLGIGYATTLADLVTNDNIGDYIDLGNNIIGEATTTDDWRVFYVDEESDTVYAILADYLPASLVPEAAGLDKVNGYQYGVSLANADKDAFVNVLKNEIAWNTFKNGMPGAQVIGTPTEELFISSYNKKNGTNYVDIYEQSLDRSAEDYDLYVPHASEYESCNGYWLATISTKSADQALYIASGGFGGGSYCYYPFYGVRPVVSLPLSTAAELVDGVLTITQ